MKITASEPIVITPPPRTYTLVLTEPEMLGLRALAHNSSTINISNHRGCYKSDGDPERIKETLLELWVKTNQFINKWNLR